MHGTVPRGELERMIDHSYGLVVKSMIRKARAQLELHFTFDQLYGSP